MSIVAQFVGFYIPYQEASRLTCNAMETFCTVVILNLIFTLLFVCLYSPNYLQLFGITKRRTFIFLYRCKVGLALLPGLFRIIIIIIIDSRFYKRQSLGR